MIVVVVAVVCFAVGFLAALRWAGFFDALEDVRRLDWLQKEQERADSVMSVSIRGYYQRDRRFWVNARGSIRDAIDRGRKMA